MTSLRPPPRGQRIAFGSLAVIALLSGVRVSEYDPIPWGLVAGFAIGVAILAGPVAWAVRDRLPTERREHLGYVASAVVLLCVPVVLGLGLVSGTRFLVVDAGAFGSSIGFAVALLLEELIVPERLRDSAR